MNEHRIVFRVSPACADGLLGSFIIAHPMPSVNGELARLVVVAPLGNSSIKLRLGQLEGLPAVDHLSAEIVHDGRYEPCRPSQAKIVDRAGELDEHRRAIPCRS